METKRPLLKVDEVCVGCIVWLPRKKVDRNVLLLGQSDALPGAKVYHHPAVILRIISSPLSRYTGDYEICFALLTTFKDLEVSKYAIIKGILPDSIPIVDTVNPGSSPNLHLERRKVLFKQSYVRLDSIYRTKLSNLRSYNNDHTIELPAYNWRLDEGSYYKLMCLLNLEAQEFPSTDNVMSTRYNQNHSNAVLAPLSINNPLSTRTPLSTNTPNVQRSRDAKYLPDPTGNIDEENGQITTCASGSAATLDLENVYIEGCTPPADSLRCSESLLDTADAATQYCNDTRSDATIQSLQSHHANPSGITYDIETQLPLPATQSTGHYRGHDGSHWCKMLYALCLCLVSLLQFCLGWMIWCMARN